MTNKKELNDEFIKHGGIMKTSELKAFGLGSRQILRLLEDNVMSKIKTGFYEIVGLTIPDEVLITKLFPTSVIYLESALLHYGYTERIPSSWQIAVDRNISKSQLKISYPPIMPFFLDNKFIEIGLVGFEVNGVKIRIYNKERTICDVLRYANKLDREVFTNAIHRYVKDKDRNIKLFMEYAKRFRVTQKAKTYVGVWL